MIKFSKDLENALAQLSYDIAYELDEVRGSDAEIVFGCTADRLYEVNEVVDAEMHKLIEIHGYIEVMKHGIGFVATF